jgi:hypothetical protein
MLLCLLLFINIYAVAHVLITYLLLFPASFHQTMQRWLAVRLDFIVGFALSLAALSVPIWPSSISANIIGVMLTQGMSVTGILQFAVRQVCS